MQKFASKLAIIIFAALIGTQAMTDDKLITKSTSLLPVETIEPSVKFWQAVGFAVTMRVPEDGPMGFAGISNGTVEIMLRRSA